MPTSTPQAERVTVTVEGPISHPDVLSVEDAMAQVLDYFVLLEASAPEETSVIWRLVSATTQSPLTVVAEATSLDPDLPMASITSIAKAQKHAFTDNLKSVQRGERPIAWDGGRASGAVTALLKRTTNGIGSVTVQAEEGARVIIDTNIARTALASIEKKSTVFEFRKHVERGSVEGTITQIGFHYNRPSIRVLQRGTGTEVFCIVSTEVKEHIQQQIGSGDVWDKHRVTVYGSLQYGDEGRLARVVADKVNIVTIPRTTIDDILDPGFTDGLEATEYLRLFREGELG
ncbi:MAG: hypothetical protein NVSMB64_28960 [Candidatus Velthaea sp.]